MTDKERDELNMALARLMGRDVGSRAGHKWVQDPPVTGHTSYSCSRCGQSENYRREPCYVAPPDCCGSAVASGELIAYLLLKDYGVIVDYYSHECRVHVIKRNQLYYGVDEWGKIAIAKAAHAALSAAQPEEGG